MTEVSVEALQQAVEGLHDCRARLRVVVPVTEYFDGKVVWDGTVHIFDLEGHPTAKTAFAWSSPIEGSVRRRFYAVLRQPPVYSASDAVRASIVSDHRAGKTDA